MRVLSCILLVDDNKTTNFLHQRLPGRLAVAQQLVVVTNGRQALDYLTSHKGEAQHPSPTLILLDLRMPVLDGWAFLEAYRQLPWAQRQAPVFVLALPTLSIAEIERRCASFRHPIPLRFNRSLASMAPPTPRAPTTCARSLIFCWPRATARPSGGMRKSVNRN
ncbi:response regulator [Hymenobacter sp. YC55]|uniref:response regulator n=1 Tax=Hymenobacter sp. YC55 TaxID=3034019 RepID=UPI0023F7A944|nr:response regulator [Hymenobacter sp. YC55]MDF7815067.1 response regulator [Hymenobacter sp. YC55]